MNITVPELCQLLREHMDIPVYDTELPIDKSSPFVVVKKENSNYNKDNNLHINIYVPNKQRVLCGYIDNLYPDTNKIDSFEKQLLKIYYDNISTFQKIHIKKYLTYKNLHFININITSSRVY